MHLNRKILSIVSNTIKRHSSSKLRLAVTLEENVSEDINNERITPRKHPGIFKSRSISIPDNIIDAIRCTLGDTPPKTVLQDSISFVNYLKSRHLPSEDWQVKAKRREIINDLEAKDTVDFTGKTAEEIENINRKREYKIENILKQKIYNWSAIKYDKNKCLQYLISRAAPEFAALCRVFKEINMRVENYKPVSFFDFGSGVGTGLWAARETWGDSLTDIFTVDTSADMNNLARLILCGGVENDEVPIKKFFQRQFLPAFPTKYDIVLSAYSLFEMPSAHSRLLTIQNLWRKAKDFLILVELGTNNGYSIINEARDFILEVKEGPLVGHVFSPCSHDLECPRFLSDNTPCNFKIPYNTLQFSDKIEQKEELFSYIVFRKGSLPDGEVRWPRIVRPTLVRSKHTICRMCCPDGKLKELIVTPKRYGKSIYHCARSSNWGDSLPIRIEELNAGSSSEDNPLNEQSIVSGASDVGVHNIDLNEKNVEPR